MSKKQGQLQKKLEELQMEETEGNGAKKRKTELARLTTGMTNLIPMVSL